MTPPQGLAKPRPWAWRLLVRSDDYQRMTAVPQASPAPKPLRTMRSPRWDAALPGAPRRGARRDRAGGGVAVALEVVEHALAGDVQDVDGGVDDADVGLVRDVEIDLVPPSSCCA